MTGKRILLGISGGIAAYKVAELTRLLTQGGASVNVMMTRNATEFITPLTMQTLSGNPVFTDLFRQEIYDINHIALAEWADVVVLAPATANLIGKIANGIADDLVSTVVMASRAPVLVCPAMNTAMYENGIVQDNIARLRAHGYRIEAPASGKLACGAEGTGRLADPSTIVEAIQDLLTPKDLCGETVLVTAGPTREFFDPVRYLSNPSSGKMGFALAAAAQRRGAKVTLVSGPTSLPCPRGIEVIAVTTALEMHDAVMARISESTIIIKAAAVADYRPAVRATEKVKKTDGPVTVVMERNPDILAEIGKTKGSRLVMGFAMETENLLAHAKAKLKAKHLDFIVANDLREEGAGFQHDTNRVRLIDKAGHVETLPLMDKTALADCLLDRIRMAKNA